MTAAIIVQARLGSTRLPAKVLLPLPTGRAVLEEVLWRCKRIPGVDVVVCAIPDTAENDILERLVGVAHLDRAGDVDWGVKIVRGPEHDVLARYVKAAEAVKADVIMRVTADCPLIDPEVCGRVLRTFQEQRPYYCSNVRPRSFPQGLDCEVFHRAALDRANVLAEASDDREHVTPFIIREAGDSVANVTSRELDHLLEAKKRWTLDTLDDYIRIWNLFERQMREAA